MSQSPPNIINEQLDNQLQCLTLAAQQHPHRSLERQSILREWVSLVLHCGKLYRPRQGEFPGVYDDIYNEALQDLLLFVCQNIHQYNPERASVITWLNMLMARRFFKEAIPKVLGRKEVQLLDLDAIDHFIAPNESENLADALTEYVATDPDGFFRKTCIETIPQANFQAIAQQRLAGSSWKEIATAFDTNISTVSTFYYRCLKKFTPMIRAYCLGQQPPETHRSL